MAASSPTKSHDYVVVARRYRPQTFEQLIGQQHVSQALARAIRSGRVGHAYLFTGARGVGKTSAARILAKALNCEQGPAATPCNQCELCQAVSSGDDVDVLEIDGASNRGIDEIRQLRQNVAVRPSRARFKIYIIDEVHMLTKEAFNALLKTLEEPPEHVKFIFATTEPNKIPVTILSRCQRYDFAGIDTADILSRLGQIAASEGVRVEEDALQILALRAAGSMRDSQSLLEQLLSTGTDTITAADVTAMLGLAPVARLSRLVAPLVARDAATALTELDAAIDEGAEVSQLIDQLLGYFRDVMTQAVGCSAERLLYALPAQQQEILQVAEQLGVETLLAMVQVLDHTAARMRVSSHTRTLAEMALVRICHLENLDELSGLIRELRQSPAAAAPAASVKKNVTPHPPAAPVTPSEPPVSPPAHPPAEVAPSADDPTPPAPAQPAIALSAENVEVVWKQVLDSLTGMIMDHAAEAQQVRVDAQGRLVLDFAENFHREICERGQNRARLETALEKVCGTRVPLVTRSPGDTALQPAARPPSRRQRQADLANQPFVKTALELFHGDPAQLRYVPPPEKSP